LRWELWNPTIQIERTTCGLRNSESPTTENLVQMGLVCAVLVAAW
jgi:hypothetical protein